MGFILKAGQGGLGEEGVEDVPSRTSSMQKSASRPEAGVSCGGRVGGQVPGCKGAGEIRLLA